MNSKVIGTIAVAIIAVIIGLFQPLNGLASQGHLVLASVLFALGFWIFKPYGMPFSVGCAIIIAGCVIFGMKIDQVTSGFVGSAVWVLIPALYFGFILQKTGLGKRVAYLVLKAFNPSWATMALSWFIIGVALSALTPSITVRIAIIMPIAISVVEACRQEFRSKGAAFITIIAWAMCLFPGTGWLTGSLTGPIMLGFMPPELKSLVTFDSWLQILFVPWMLITVIFVVLVYLVMKPKESIGITKDTFKEQYAALGPITRDEITAIIILVGALLFFSTEKIHGIPSAAVALSAFALLIMTRLITGPEISSGINWDVVLFFGVAVSLQGIFALSGVAGWIEPIISPTMLSLAASPLTLLLVATFGFLLIRFIDVPWGYASVAATIAVLIPIYNQFGIHPLVASIPYLIGINFFLLSYQQPFITMGEGLTQGRGWAPGHVTQAGVIYIIACVAAILISMPYWSMIGVI